MRRIIAHGDLVIEVFAEGKKVAVGTGLKRTEIQIPNPRLWSPEDPFLYELDITLGHWMGSERAYDKVTSYFGMRKIEVKKDEAGVNRLFLNNKPLFQLGPLDQGWWPDGLYTAASDEALRYDLEVTKKLGMNMLRKHVKIEPARFYYWCDKLGVLVWQDMPSGDKYIGGKDADIKRSPESAENFERELKAMVEGFYNHPSIIMWVAYNEGWGQWETPRVCELIKQWDPTRLVNNASGWSDRRVGDVHDIHRYPGPATASLEEKRALVLGEFGGLGLPIKGHTWQEEKNWGYRTYKTREELTNAYVNLIKKLRPLIGEGLSAAVYTQTSDVEIEVNGLLTYDRELIKMDVEKVAAINHKLYLPPPVIKTIVPTSRKNKQNWKYTFDDPGSGWERMGFDDSGWKILTYVKKVAPTRITANDGFRHAKRMPPVLPYRRRMALSFPIHSATERLSASKRLKSAHSPLGQAKNEKGSLAAGSLPSLAFVLLRMIGLLALCLYLYHKASAKVARYAQFHRYSLPIS